jgi:dipeptide/tripeptide permease
LFAANEAATKMAIYGLTANLTIYFYEHFNMTLVTANNVTNIFNGFFNFSLLVGAFFSDSYLGHFRTIIYASFINLLVIKMTIFIFYKYVSSTFKMTLL